MLRLNNIFIILFLFLFLISCTANKLPVHKESIPPLSSSSSVLLPNDPASRYNQISQKIKTIVQYAMQSVGTAYKWGGQTPLEGFDCSGLIVYTHKKAGIKIPRMTSMQLKNGRIVQFSDIQPADLIFFNNPDKNQGLHVGLYIGDGKFIHSPGKGHNVLVASLNNIYFKKNYIGARRFAH